MATAIKQSDWAKNIRTAHRPQTAGAVHEQRFTFDFSSVGVLATDILELGLFPANSKIVDAQLFAEGAGWSTITATVGIMSGEFGSPDASRTVDSSIFGATTVNNGVTAIQRMTKPDAFLLAPVEKHQSIGVVFSADVAAAAGKKLHLRLFYAQ